jgi:DNA mismatch repair protein MutL
VSSEHDKTSRRIQLLREDVSRKIAAGEVIDRPFSIVRELLDNSIDAGANAIDVYIEGGGIARVAVIDNGSGMSREDLLLCTERHATSKIREEGDLYRVRTLGFRGEALASVAACSRLEIVSSRRRGTGGEGVPEGGGEEAYRLRVEGGRRLGVEQWRGNPGTTVTVSDLFYNLPVRRKFLKSTAGETGMCRQSFLEKAVAHPAVTFRFFVDGKIKSFLPPQGQVQRVAEAFVLPGEHLSTLEAEQPGARVCIVAARPELTRRDKRLIQVYVNRRRIYEYSLVHAVEFAYARHMPGGQHATAFVFLELDPELVDFNIHPAKREARFRDLPALHQLVSATLKDHLRGFDIRISRPGLPAEQEGTPDLPAGPIHRQDRSLGSGFEIHTSPAGADRAPVGRWAAAHRFPATRLPPQSAPQGQDEPPEGAGGAAAGEPVYLGQLFRLFLLVEYGSSLFVVDQHAAHERVLFEELSASKPSAQELLMPIRLDIGAEAGLIEKREELFERLGVRVEPAEDGAFEITALPEALISVEEEELVQALLWEKGSVDELIRRVYSLAACRLAVKEGKELDPITATELVRRTFRLPDARCPHGRPIWFEVRRERLLREVQRL